MHKSNRIITGFTLSFVLTCAIPSMAQRTAGGLDQAGPQADQANEIVCSSATACKTGSVPLFATDGGSAQVRDSIMTQSGGAVKIAGGARTSGNITAGGDLDAGGNVNAINVNVTGNVGASTVTTTDLTGGVSSTMTGTGNSIAALQGSATATGAAGFTFGVIGQSASDQGRGVFGSATGATGVGVIGESSGASGFGVIGKDLSGGGFAFSATGNAQQNRSGGGWVKALVFVSAGAPPYHIARCYNSTLAGSAATTPPCGFSLNELVFGVYTIDFGFEVDDRFWSVTAARSVNDNPIIADADADAGLLGSNRLLRVLMTANGGDNQTSDFTVVMY